ncbi:pyridoxal phosphate-dependent aminotransferase [Wenxinia marina]|uniref:Aminotransferase n=1 Tax=Wenxinia marina DSM 24838 TaxID=1123501 RepID=A0A0D0NHI7_9RHOB|nr:aminotransferase class I/II-fold pyridoxal phosphate-dependent enzyme [Wenxinia marina]KIQ67795.1 Aspartate/tyrosine/aromatic aminotransferase [Wenxinia marina DSM 24838]GGL75001.1 aminotransferase [Wenxinia marina]
MTLSRRITTLTTGGDDGWGLYRRARALKEAGQPIVELTIGEHDVPTDPSILSAMDAAARGGHTGYSPIAGSAALREAIAERVTRTTGAETRAENVLVTPGGQAALFAAHMAACDPGDRALFIDPYYATYPGTVRAAGAIPVAVPAPASRGFVPNPAALAEAAQGARSLLINTPNNPAGVVYDRAALDGIARVVTDRGMWLISDEVYDAQVWEGAHLSPRALPGMAERTLVVGSLSKSHAMTGSRLGWVIGPPDAIAAMIDLATHTTYGIPGFVQQAGLYALRQGPEFEARIAEPFRRRREITRDLVARQQAVGLAPMGGAMYAMLDVRATGLSGSDFAEGLLDAEGVAVMPGESFGAAAAGHVRVAMTVEDAAYADALGRLLAFAAARAGARRGAAR